MMYLPFFKLRFSAKKNREWRPYIVQYKLYVQYNIFSTKLVFSMQDTGSKHLVGGQETTLSFGNTMEHVYRYIDTFLKKHLIGTYQLNFAR